MKFFNAKRRRSAVFFGVEERVERAQDRRREINCHNSFAAEIISVVIVSVLGLTASDAAGRDLTLQDAFDIALRKSSRGEIIRGDLDVAEQNYRAERINFYVPEISINGELPVYNVSESFDNLFGLSEKRSIRRTNLNFNSDITLQQSLLTGGDFSIEANLVNNDATYPQVFSSNEIRDVTQTSKQGVFDFAFTQPLLKPSEPKNALDNRKDDLEIARLTQVEEIATLKKEVVEAYFGALQTSVKYDINRDKMEKAKLQQEVDSAKFDDGVISEETWLESSSLALDAELGMFDIENQQSERNRELALLLDIDASEKLSPAIPVINGHLGESEKSRYINSWEYSIPIKKAEYAYSKSDRQADFTASSHGLTGTFMANYSLGRGDVTVEDVTSTNNTDSWGLAVNFTFPVWDGGSKGAEIKAARLTAQKSEIEYDRAKRSTRAAIVNLVNRLDISYRKLDVLRQQIEIAKNKLDIAQFRMDDGQISRLNLLDSKVYYLEAQDKYLEELKKYILDKIELEGKYIS